MREHPPGFWPGFFCAARRVRYCHSMMQEENRISGRIGFEPRPYSTLHSERDAEPGAARRPPAKWVVSVALAGLLLVAAALRLAGLPDPPPGLHYDEAANVLMASQIAYGGARPVHIDAFEGREVVYFYLSALMMRLLSDGELALRLTAAFCGLVAVAATVPIGQGWFRSRAVGALAATFLAISLWNVIQTRLALESATTPLAQAVALALWGGALRRARWRGAMAAAGVAAGLVLYTYYAGRAFPVVIAAGWVALLVLTKDRRLRLRQLAVFGVAALLTVTPLAVYFAAHPDQILGRIEQVGPWGGEGAVSVLEGVRLTAGMFFVQGDPQVRWNLPNRPIFDPVSGALMVVGVIVSLGRAARPGDPVTRAGYALLIANLLVMSLPSALAVRGLPPNYNRSMGLPPLLFVLPAVGVEAIARALPARRRQAAVWAAVGVAVIAGGLHTRYLYFEAWSPRADLFFDLDGDLEAAGRWLNAHARPDETIYVAAAHYQHPTLAVVARDYDRLRWLPGSDVLILPPDGQDALMIFPRSVPPGLWSGLLGGGRVADLPLAPDGGAAFEAFRFAAGDAPRPTPGVALEAYFGGVLALRGADVNPEPGRGLAEATLYWEVLRTPAQDMRLTLDLRDPWGLPWGKEHVFVGDARAWQPGEWLATRVRVRVPPGTPPLDHYVLRAGWVTADAGALVPTVNAEGRYASTAAAVPGLVVGRQHASPEQFMVAGMMPVDVADGVQLLGWNREVTAARPGDPVFLTLHWRALEGSPRGEVVVRIRLVNRAGTSLLLWEGAPVHNTYPSRLWLPNEIVADRYAGALPRDLPPGEYTMRLSVGQVVVDLGPLTVQDVARTFTAPPVDESVDALFGDAIRLLGVNIDRREVRPGEALSVELVWRCEQPVEERYTVFVHLYNSDGTIRTQIDRAPVEGAYPTSLWAAGEVVTDRYTLSISPDTPAGTYTLGVGLYLPESGVRLPVAGSDWVNLGAVQVTQ